MVQYKYWMVHACAGGPSTKMYEEFKNAVAEAKRLSAQNPGKRFAVMESIECFEVSQPEPKSVPIEIAPKPFL